MIVCFRVDASIDIGSGHVMRCLTLAEALKEQGAACFFICRAHSGHFIDYIRGKGFTVFPLECVDALSSPDLSKDNQNALSHADWLGSSWQADADETRIYLEKVKPDWLIVDHYALDQQWELTLKPRYQKLAVIDDLADREHVCDLLLDQTLGRKESDYKDLVPDKCTLLLGAKYALLRPEFLQWRDYSLRRRVSPKLDKLLITLGGVDKDDATGQILRALCQSHLPKDCEITVVMGATALHLKNVQALAKTLPWQIEIKVNVSNMAELMSNADLAIGAAGSTSWERCCLGLPTLMVVLAENQRVAASYLELAQAALNFDSGLNLTKDLRKLLSKLINDQSEIKKLSENASRITSGRGAELVLAEFES